MIKCIKDVQSVEILYQNEIILGILLLFILFWSIIVYTFIVCTTVFGYFWALVIILALVLYFIIGFFLLVLVMWGIYMITVKIEKIMCKI